MGCKCGGAAATVTGPGAIASVDAIYVGQGTPIHISSVDTVPDPVVFHINNVPLATYPEGGNTYTAYVALADWSQLPVGPAAMTMHYGSTVGPPKSTPIRAVPPNKPFLLTVGPQPVPPYTVVNLNVTGQHFTDPAWEVISLVTKNVDGIRWDRWGITVNSATTAMANGSNTDPGRTAHASIELNCPSINRAFLAEGGTDITFS